MLNLNQEQGCLAALIPVFKIIPQNQVMVIERLGKFSRMAESGVATLVPILDRPRVFTTRYVEEDSDGMKRVVTQRSAFIDLREQVLDFPSQSVITSDNVVMEINAILYYKVKDPYKAVYEIANFAEAIEKLTQTTLRNVVGELTLDATLSSRDQINHRLLSILDEATADWGVDVTRVELQDINPPSDIRRTMELQMTAERKKRAQLLDSEADKATAVLRAEGEAEARVREAEAKKDAAILDAEGQAQAVKAIAEGNAQARRLSVEAEANALETLAGAIGKDKAVEYLLGLKYLESLEKIATGEGNKTFIPYEASSVLGAVGTLKEMFGADKKEKTD